MVLLFSMLLGTIGYLATDVYLPSLPNMAKDLAISDNLTQLTITVFLLSFSLAPLFAGPISDRVGRRSISLFGLFFGFFATIITMFAWNIHILLIGRFLQGFAFGMLLPVSRAILVDKFHGEHLVKYMSYNGMLLPIVMGIAPAIGGVIGQYYSWRYAFGFLFLLTASLTLLVMCFFKETIKSSHDITSWKKANNKTSNLILFTKALLTNNDWQQVFAMYRQLASNPRFIFYVLSHGFSVAGLVSYLISAPFIFENIFGYSVQGYGFLYMVSSSAVIFGSIANNAYVKNLHINTIFVIIATLFTSCGLILAFLIHNGQFNDLSLLAVSWLYFFTLGIAGSNTIGHAMNNISSNFGTASALTTTILQLSGMFASGIVSIFSKNDGSLLALIFTAIGLLQFCIMFHLKNNVLQPASQQ